MTSRNGIVKMSSQCLIMAAALLFLADGGSAGEVSGGVSGKCQATEDISDAITPLVSLVASPTLYECKVVKTRGILYMDGREAHLFLDENFLQSGWFEYSIRMPVTPEIAKSEGRLDRTAVTVIGVFSAGSAGAGAFKQGRLLQVKSLRN